MKNPNPPRKKLEKHLAMYPNDLLGGCILDLYTKLDQAFALINHHTDRLNEHQRTDYEADIDDSS